MEDGDQLFPSPAKDIRRKMHLNCGFVIRKSSFPVRLVKHWNGNLSNFLSLKAFPNDKRHLGARKSCPEAVPSTTKSLQFLASPTLGSPHCGTPYGPRWCCSDRSIPPHPPDRTRCSLFSPSVVGRSCCSLFQS